MPPWAEAYLAGSVRREESCEEMDGEEVVFRWFSLDGRKHIKRLLEVEEEGMTASGRIAA